jgi:hypothetical protein
VRKILCGNVIRDIGLLFNPIKKLKNNYNHKIKLKQSQCISPL